MLFLLSAGDITQPQQAAFTEFTSLSSERGASLYYLFPVHGLTNLNGKTVESLFHIASHSPTKKEFWGLRLNYKNKHYIHGLFKPIDEGINYFSFSPFIFLNGMRDEEIFFDFFTVMKMIKKNNHLIKNKNQRYHTMHK